MSRPGSNLGLLDQLHANGCDGHEYTTMRPVVVTDEYGHGTIEVVVMEWCEACGAADYEVV